MKREGITVLINLSSKEIPNHFKDDETYTYYNFDIEDEEGFEISQFFRKIYDVIVKVKADGKKALMFDEEGRNVVTTLTVAYMLYSSKKQEKYLPLQKALEFVASKEPSMKPSLDFLQQLCKLEMDLFDESSVRTGGGRGGRGGRGGKRH